MKPRITHIIIFLTQLSFSTFSQNSIELHRKKDSLTVLIEDLEQNLTSFKNELAEVNQKIALIELDSILKSSTSARISKSLEGKMRNGVTPQSKVIYMIPKNSEIQLLGYSNAYFKIIYNNKTGYLNELYVKFTDEVNKFKEAHSDSNFEFETKNQPRKKRSSGRTYRKGSRGGCYYINKSGNKVYVNRDICN